MGIPPEYADRVRVEGSGCWVWTGWIIGRRHGTGSRAPYGALQREKKVYRAHRYFYELATGVDPGADHVHHRCENTLCVNPAHLEALPASVHSRQHNLTTHQLNIANKARETCPHGHPWTDANTYINPEGVRHCRACNRETMRRWREVRGLQGKPKTACPKGHPYSGDNLYLTREGHRACRECRRVQAREGARRRRQRITAAA